MAGGGWAPKTSPITVDEAQQDLVAWLLQEDVDVDLRLFPRVFGTNIRNKVGCRVDLLIC